MRLVIQDTIKTNTTAPIIEGISAIPAKLGPHDPRRLSPNQEPIKPATMLLIHPIAAPRLVIAPAIAPIIAPTISVQINPIMISLLPALYQNLSTDYHCQIFSANILLALSLRLILKKGLATTNQTGYKINHSGNEKCTKGKRNE